MFSATSFAQFSQGTWTFGVDHNFTTTAETANASYFVMDGIMVSLEFDMTTDSGNSVDDDASTNWGIGARYYIGDDGLWAGANVNSAEGMNDAGEMEDGMDMSLAVGCSKVLGMDGHLWFEPYIGIDMPFASEEEHDGEMHMHQTDAMSLGLGMGFRFAF
jgi:hypothetical protein